MLFEYVSIHHIVSELDSLGYIFIADYFQTIHAFGHFGRKVDY